MTLGSHGDTMVPVPSQCTVDGKPLSELLPRRHDRASWSSGTRNGGAEVVALLKTGSAYYAPSRGGRGHGRGGRRATPARRCRCAPGSTGQFGITGVYLGVPAKLGRGGVAAVDEMPLTDAELAALREAAEAVRAKQADVAKLIG